MVTVRTDVGPGGNINAIGYNTLDDYIYGTVENGDGTSSVIRIDAKGGSVVFPDIVVPGIQLIGDIDGEGNLWFGRGNSMWYKVDLNSDSPTFGEIVDSGELNSPRNMADWAYVPGGGDYLWTILYSGGGTNSALARWSTTTHEWEIIEELGDVAGENRWGAMYPAGDGTLYASENVSGDIWQFRIPIEEGDRVLYEKITDGPPSGSNDGARCFFAPAP
ncbi:hypothetical protein ACRALDRAFT_1083264 [Sodiomyces alcalophilus JCM 7366]|uniref:uncharacterized protein n=1 Tax=Sodiomyces alcalophilus JCM 7366 TaxID=591952 RepID=UPI0039B53317